MLYNDVCTKCVYVYANMECNYVVVAYREKEKRKTKNGAKQHFYTIAVRMSMVNRFIDFFYDLYLSVHECVLLDRPMHLRIKHHRTQKCHTNTTKINNFRMQ